MSDLPQERAKWKGAFARLIPATSAVLLGYSLLNKSWSWARVPEISPDFADMRMVTHTATCMIEGNWSESAPSCDPFGRIFNYPIIWARTFAALRLGELQTSQIGVVLGIVVIAALVIPLFKIAASTPQVSRLIAAALCVISPPVALQLERANADGVILVLFGVASTFYFRARWVSVALSSLGTALKLFPLVSVMAFVPRHRRDWSPAGFFLGVLVVLAASGDNIIRLIERQDPPGEYRFGSLLLLYHFLPPALNYPRTWLLFAGVTLTVIPALCLLLVFKTQVRGLSQVLAEEGPGTSLFLFGGLLYVGTFISGSRYDYSQQFLVLCVLGIALLKDKNPLVSTLLLLAPVSLWGAFWLDPESLAGDIATSVCVSIILAVLIQSRVDAIRQLTTANTR